jgi:hypothetical protein
VSVPGSLSLSLSEMAKREEVVAAVIAGFESKNQKLVVIAINILQKLLLLHGIRDVRVFPTLCCLPCRPLSCMPLSLCVSLSLG